jgi:hypothetical protein
VVTLGESDYRLWLGPGGQAMPYVRKRALKLALAYTAGTILAYRTY